MFKWGKKNKNKNKPKKTTKSPQSDNSDSGTPVVRRKKHLFGNNSSKFPVIRALKIPEQIPSAILDLLSTQADEEDGAVRRVDGGYSVIMISEQTLEEQQLVPKNKSSDFGQFSASLRKRDNITSTTLKGDMDLGFVVMAPNKHTIESLDEFDQLRDGVQFQWAVFPDTLDDDDLDAHVTELDNSVDLADLTQISGNNWQLSVVDNKMIVNQESDDNDDDESYSDDDYDTDDDNDEDYESDDDDGSYQYNDDDDEMSDEDDEDEDTDEADDEPAPQSSQTPDTSSDADMSQQAQDVFNQSPSSDASANNNQGTDNDPSEPPASLNASSDSAINGDDAFWNQILQGSVPSDDDLPNATQTNSSQPQETAPQTNNQGAPNADQGTSQFTSEVGKVGVQQLHDQDLDLTVDTSVFNQMFDASKPFEVAPLKINADGTDLFDKVVNEARADANTKLVNLNNRHRQQLIAEYINRVQQMIVSINKRLSIDSNNTTVGNAKRIIEENYQNALSQQDATAEQQGQDLRDEYENRKNEAGEQARLQARQAFDEQHLSHLHQDMQQIKQNVNSSIINERVASLHDLNERRKQAAQLTYKDVNSKILTDMEGMFQQMREDEANLAGRYENNLRETMDRLYRDDVKRQQAIADSKQHDNTINQLQAEKQRLMQDNQQALENLKQENQSQLDSLASRYQDAHQKLVDSYNAKINDQVRQLQEKDNKYNELEQQIATKIEQRTNDLKSDYQEQFDHMKRRYDDARADLQAARDTIVANQKEYAIREQSYGQQVDQAQRSNRHTPLVVGVTVGFAMLTLGAGAGIAVDHMVRPAGTYSTQSNNQANTNSNVPNITINGGSQGTDSSSSHSDKSSKAKNSDTHKSNDKSRSHVSVDDE